MANYEEISCVIGMTAEWIREFGWTRGSFERKGKYCLVGMIRCAVLGYESEWMAECGEEEMTSEEYGLYRTVMKDICGRIGIDTAGLSTEELIVKIQNFNDNKCETVEDVLAVLS